MELTERGKYSYRTSFKVTNAQTKEIYTFGIDFGPHAYILDETEHYLIMYVPSHKSWCGIGMGQGNYPAYYYLCEHTVTEDELRALNILYEIAPGSRWREARALLRAKMKELEAEYNK